MKAIAVVLLLLGAAMLVHGQPSIALTANMFLTTAYEWSVTKTGPDTSISIQQGSAGTASYTVAFTRTATDIPVYTVQGQVTVTNPNSIQLQLSQIQVQAQYPAAAAGPINSSVSCPQYETLDSMLLVDPAVPGSGYGTFVCNYTVLLPSADEGYVVATAIQTPSTDEFGDPAMPLVSKPTGFAVGQIGGDQPVLTLGECATVNDTFDPLSFQHLRTPQTISGTKPPDSNKQPDKICSSSSYSYTIQWTVTDTSSCGDYIVSSTAVVAPIDSSQGPQSATAYLEVNACNYAEQGVPAPVADQPVADDDTPQLTLSISGITGGSSSFSWGAANQLMSPSSLTISKGGSVEVTYTTSFTRSQNTQPAPYTITGALTVTNPTAETMELTEVEVSYSSSDGQQQQVDTAASCQTSVGGSVIVNPGAYVICIFTVIYNSQENGYVWASAVTANGLNSQSEQVPVILSDAGTVTPGAVAGCATAQQSFQSGSPGLVLPASFTSDSQVPPSSSSPQQLCDSAIYTYTAVFGPFTACGKMQAVNVASVNPTGGQQSTQSAAITVAFTVLC
uniref:Uncharacterized protein n=1 Tax=Tetradesmus obliquus TaxID=3088 RepID=A0A383VU27_TETOB|eukprot:jgi/Sobl393_1/13125/SZX68393.1